MTWDNVAVGFKHKQKKTAWILATARLSVVTPHAHARAGGYSDQGWCPYIYVCGQKQNLNRTLAINSHFQTFVVGLLVDL